MNATEDGMQPLGESPAVESQHQHFVRFEIRDEGRVSAEFHCAAPEDSGCRRWCGTCIDEGRDRCQCDELDRQPVLRTFPCNYLQWMGDAPDECYDGPARYIPGPDLTPVTFSWEGDYFTWNFADRAHDPHQSKFVE